MEDAYRFFKRDDIFLVANSEGIVLDFTQGVSSDEIVLFIHSLNECLLFIRLGLC